VEVVGLDGQRLPLPDDSADAALCTWTLCSIPDATAAVREVRRVLRPGAKLHFVEHGASPDPKVRRWQDRFNPIQNRIAGGCNLNRDIRSIIEAGGLRVERLDNYYGEGEPKMLGWLSEGCAVKD
jgi:ubiquinone/menaquinone biosynthesis C-methylase UbiE